MGIVHQLCNYIPYNYIYQHRLTACERTFRQCSCNPNVKTCMQYWIIIIIRTMMENWCAGIWKIVSLCSSALIPPFDVYSYCRRSGSFSGCIFVFLCLSCFGSVCVCVFCLVAFPLRCIYYQVFFSFLYILVFLQPRSSNWVIVTGCTSSGWCSLLGDFGHLFA